MSDPARILRVHTCNKCYRAIHCRRDCPQTGEVICAVCAAGHSDIRLRGLRKGDE